MASRQLPRKWRSRASLAVLLLRIVALVVRARWRRANLHLRSVVHRIGAGCDHHIVRGHAIEHLDGLRRLDTEANAMPVACTIGTNQHHRLGHAICCGLNRLRRDREGVAYRPTFNGGVHSSSDTIASL